MRRVRRGSGVSVLKLWVAAVAAACLAASPAAAATFYTVYRGVVAGGADPAGAFGSADVAGASFVAVFEVTDAGASEHLTGLYSERLYGGPGTCGSGSGCANPVVAARLTLNGRTVAFPAGPGSYGMAETANLFGAPGGDSSSVTTLSQTLWPDLNATLALTAYPLDAPTRFGPYAGAQGGDDTPPGTAYWSETVGGVATTRFDLSLRVDRVFITGDPGSVVPEPGAWAMMLLGFGAIGVALRRRGATASLAI